MYITLSSIQITPEFVKKNKHEPYVHVVHWFNTGEQKNQNTERKSYRKQQRGN